MRGACFLHDVDIWIALEKIDRFQINAIHRINIAIHQGCLTRGWVDDRNQFHLIKMRAALFPIIRVALQNRFHTGLKRLNDVATSADT